MSIIDWFQLKIVHGLNEKEKQFKLCEINSNSIKSHNEQCEYIIKNYSKVSSLQVIHLIFSIVIKIFFFDLFFF